MESSRIGGDPHAQVHQDHILFMPDQIPAQAASAPWRRIACICSGVVVLLAAFIFADIYSMISSATTHDLHVRLHCPTHTAQGSVFLTIILHMFGQIQEIEIVPHADRQLVAHVNASPSLSSFLMHHKVPASGFLGHRTVNSVAFTIAICTTGSDSIRADRLLVGGDALQTRGSPCICIDRSIYVSICSFVYFFYLYLSAHTHTRARARTHIHTPTQSALTRTHTYTIDRIACNQFLRERWSAQAGLCLLFMALPRWQQPLS